MKKTKVIPVIVTLISGLIATGISIWKRYEVTRAMGVILVVLIIFYILGNITKVLVEKYVIEEEEIQDLEYMAEDMAEDGVEEFLTEEGTDNVNDNPTESQQ